MTETTFYVSFDEAFLNDLVQLIEDMITPLYERIEELEWKAHEHEG